MKINWKVRFKNPVFYAQLIMSIIIPIVAYFGITVEDLTSWQYLGEVLWGAITNPYLLAVVVVSVFNTIIDPTTKGLRDSDRAMTYKSVKGDVE